MSVGATGPAREWQFAEGYTGPGFQQFVTIANPGAGDTSAHVRFRLADGAVVSTDVPVPASRASARLP